MFRCCVCIVSLVFGIVGTVYARQTPTANPEASPFTFEGPPAPVAPDVVTHDDAGRTTIRAVRITSPPKIDGHLDEAVFGSPMVYILC